MERQSLHLELFGGRVAVIASDEDDAATAAALCLAEDRLREWHTTLTRFDEESELSRLNRDSRPVVPASPMVLDLAGAVSWAGELSGGLVDATQLGALERAGYAASLARADSAALTLSGRRVALPPRRPAGPDAHRRWSRVAVDRARGVVCRPPGVRLDSGGLAKGLGAAHIPTRRAHLARVAVDCAGAPRLGGREPVARRILVADPVGDGHVA